MTTQELNERKCCKMPAWNWEKANAAEANEIQFQPEHLDSKNSFITGIILTYEGPHFYMGHMFAATSLHKTKISSALQIKPRKNF